MTKQALIATFFVFGMVLANAPTAKAAQVTLPQQFQHEGLNFFAPLTYSSKTLSSNKLTITFVASKKLEIKKEQKKEVLEELILTPTLTQKITSPTPTPSPIPTATSTPPQIPVTTAPAGSLDAEKLFAMANSYRQSKGLPALQKDERSCSLATTRAPEVAHELATGTLHSGLQARNLPYWNTENIIAMHSEEASFNWWINDTIHRQAIEGNYTYSCVACAGNSCAQEFTNYQPK